MSENVQLTDLDIIARYSIAVRTASADRDELIYTLRADLAWLERGYRLARPAPTVESGPDYDDTAATRIDPAADTEGAPDGPATAEVAADSAVPASGAGTEAATPKKQPAAPKNAAVKKTVPKKTAAKKAAPKKTVAKKAAR